MTDNAQGLPEFIENIDAPEVFATSPAMFSITAGSIVSISFVSTRWNGVESRFQNVVIGRLAMPISGAQHLSIALNDFLQKHGLDPSAALQGGQPTQ